MAAVNPLSIGAAPVGANIAYGIGPTPAEITRKAGAMTNAKARAAAGSGVLRENLGACADRRLDAGSERFLSGASIRAIHRLHVAVTACH